jgi:hypothetical protein
MVKGASPLVLGVWLGIGGPHAAGAANLNELSKYLAFIEGFQHLFEFCQAETTLPDEQVTYARLHIGERRAFIFTGLDEAQRVRISADSPAKKKTMLDGIARHVRQEHPGKTLKDLCREGYFEGVMAAEKESDDEERAAIAKAKQR